MFDAITEMFLNTYFMFEAVIGKLTGEPKTFFDKLYSVFLLHENKRDELFYGTQADVVREIESYCDYAQVCRIQKLSELSECQVIPSEYLDMIAVKGSALKNCNQIGFDELVEGTETETCKLVTYSAGAGLVSALCMLGFLQCEGIFVAKNEALGRANLEKAARWNSVNGIMLALAYNERDRQKNADRFYTVARGTLYESACETVRTAYGLDGLHTVPEVTLLQKAFGARILKPEVYEPQHARFIFSGLLSHKDKERALFSGHKEVISETAELPLKLADNAIPFNARAIAELPLLREREQDEIIRCAFNRDMRTDSAYRPLCISGDSEYLLNLYTSAMEKAFPSAHIEKIDAADLNEYDFEPTKNNVFVRSCDEDKPNVYFLCIKGEVRDGVLNFVKAFLQSDKRRKFRLQHPSVVIDLSAVLPVCFCDRQNARLLRAHCDVVSLAPLNAAERGDLLTYILHAKAEQYKLTKVQADGRAFGMLTEYSVERAESLIDKVVRLNCRASELIITADMLRDIASGDVEVKNKYGFGGAGNEIK